MTIMTWNVIEWVSEWVSDGVSESVSDGMSILLRLDALHFESEIIYQKNNIMQAKPLTEWITIPYLPPPRTLRDLHHITQPVVQPKNASGFQLSNT